MVIFKKNPNEVAYPGGKKPIYSVIKNEGPSNLICWKFPGEDFNTNSQLIVSESEEALFYKDGIIEEVFEGGKYALSTNNHLFVSRFRNILSGGISAFNCKVYYISKAHKLELLWGTDTPIQMRDPVYKIQTSIKARGSYSIQVIDSKKFLVKLLGNNIQVFTKEELTNYFRSSFLQHIKSGIARVITESGQEILGICTQQDIIANGLISILNETLNEYGIRIVDFYISGMDIPENDPSRLELDKLYTQKAGIGILAEDWGKIQAKEILKDLANNPSAGSVAGASMGVGLGMGAGQVIASMAAELFKSSSPQPYVQTIQSTTSMPSSRFVQKPASPNRNTSLCPKCNTNNIPDAKFCNECGHKLVQIKTRCPSCNMEMHESAKFCTDCGTKLTDGESA